MKNAIKYYLAWFSIYLPIAMTYKYVMNDRIATLIGIIVIALFVIPIFLLIFKDKQIELNYSKAGEFNVPYPILNRAIKILEVTDNE